MSRTMTWSRRAVTWLVALPLAALSAAALAADFPYDQELLMNASPMRGSKRVPSLEIGSKGETSIDLWCNTVKARLVVAGDTVTILIGDKTDNQCDPDRLSADEDLLAALQQVTGWRMQGDTLTLSGEKTLKFRLSTH
jgi:heat shock protein HslJ